MLNELRVDMSVKAPVKKMKAPVMNPIVLVAKRNHRAKRGLLQQSFPELFPRLG